MNLVKGIASIVGLGAIATTIGVGVHSLSSSQKETKKLTLGEKLKKEKIGSLGFDEPYRDNWIENFTNYAKETDPNNKFEGIKNLGDFKNKCRNLLTLEASEKNVNLFKRWCS